MSAYVVAQNLHNKNKGVNVKKSVLILTYADNKPHNFRKGCVLSSLAPDTNTA